MTISWSATGQLLEPVEVEPEAILGNPIDLPDVRAEELCGGQHRRVSRLFENHFVAGCNQRRHRKEVSHRRPAGGDDHVGSDAVSAGNRLAQRSVAIVACAIEFEVADGQRQAVEAEMRNLARREVVAHWLLVLKPVHVIGLHRSPTGRHKLTAFLRCQ